MLHPVEHSGQTLFCVLQKPDALLVKELLAAQGPDRADVDDVAGQLVVDRFAGEDVDLGVMAAAGRLCNSAVPEISRVKRTQREHRMQRSVNSVMCSPMSGLLGGVFFVVDHAALRLAEAVAEVLQHALAGLVADGAVERMIEQHVFERLPLGGLGFVAVGDEDGAVLGGGLAGGDDARLHGDCAVGLLVADFDQAHPALATTLRAGCQQ